MLNDLSPFPPSPFFDLSINIKKRVGKLSYLPDISDLIHENGFARLAVTWSEEGLSFFADVKKPLEETLYPKYREGDSLELFLDTRDLKNTPSVHQFCHHFLFLPEEVDKVQAEELTRFRTDDRHPLADPALFTVDVKVKRQGYEMEIHIPKEALHGYNPSEFKRLGFAYQFNRYQGSAQHFPFSSRFFSLEKHPQLWATLVL
jgi:hypothetical protein